MTILQQGQLDERVTTIQRLLLPDGEIFARRSARFKYLSAEKEYHSLASYLRFLGALCHGQHQEFLQHCRIYAEKDLASFLSLQGSSLCKTSSWIGEMTWIPVFRHLAGSMAEFLPERGRTVSEKLEKASDEWLFDMAKKMFAISPEIAGHSIQERGIVPFLGAALQVHCTVLAKHLRTRQLPSLAETTSCPVCGSLPSVSIVGVRGAEQGLRYLHCSLCQSYFHMVRAKCSNCREASGLWYFAHEGDETVKAEACEKCQSYLKILYQDRDPLMDPIADDIATLSLNLAMGEKNLASSGQNFFFSI